ncbi:MAG: AbiH family protein [bacterium]|nr:AbiH family protein [bacterium]
MSNILLIGNGFDLAHKLPTKYTDFLNFMQLIKYIQPQIDTHNISLNEINCYNLDPRIISLIKQKLLSSERTPINDELIEYSINNIWLDYFVQCDMHGLENWIDFESEISNVIQSLDKDLGEKNVYSSIEQLSTPFLSTFILSNATNTSYTYKQLIDTLLNDLNKLIRCFEIYLADYIDNIQCINPLPLISSLNIDCILSFNYTQTYLKLYSKNPTFYYIHGRADTNNSLETNNMVLGIDEYLKNDEKKTKIEFIEFKKFYQRILKQTGSDFVELIDNIRANRINYDFDADPIEYEDFIYTSTSKSDILYTLYIFGHSLDKTDSDILHAIICNPNVCTVIFYKDLDQKRKQIANLVNVLGPDELINKTGGLYKRITFVDQNNYSPSIISQ